MTVLERARRAAARVKSRRDGTAGQYPPPPPVPPDRPEVRVRACERSEESEKRSPAPAGYVLVRDPSGLAPALAACDESVRVAVDTETTGLDARAARVRLLQLAPDKEGTVYLLDLFALPAGALAPLWEVLRKKRLVGHNLLFDLPFLSPLGLEPGEVSDTLILSQLLHGPRKGRGFHGLARVAERELGVALPKDLQASDWSGPLSAAQLEYAARDAAVLLPVYDKLAAQVRAAGMARVAQLEHRALPALAWLSRCGIPFDRPAWDALADEATRAAAELARRLDEHAPRRAGFLSAADAWCWDSPEQVKGAFAALGIGLESTDDDALAGVDHPLAALVRRYRAAAKLASTYGRAWAEKSARGGRVYADWRQLGCITGRMASAAPNLQNLPTDPRYRACFRAPAGRLLVKADYSQVELRIAAKVAGDKAMLDAYARGEDLHTLTARRMTGKDEVSAAERRMAKPVNFGLIYGLSAGSLRRKAKAEYGVDLSAEDAEHYRRAFFAGYPGIAAWHRRLRGESTPEVRTLAGRRCPLPEKHFYGTRANYTVQGTGGDGIKLALALLWERRGECPGALPVAVVHDEVLVECDEAQADSAAAWVRRAMLDGMAPLIEPVPCEVQVRAGRTWAGD
jgi:DNA polymerase I-like protein with 3'-5' exonuclease and polymerase domains